MVALAYHSSLNSVLGGGQTIGKRAMKLRVVGKDGAPIPFPRALLRAAVPVIPWSVSSYPTWLAEHPLAGPALMSVLLVFGLGDGLIFLANRRTRQSLHDLLCGTYVVRADYHQPIALQPARALYVGFAVYAIAVGVLTTVMVILATQITVAGHSADDVRRLATLVQQQIQEDQPVTSVHTSVGTTFRSAGSTRYIQAVAYWREATGVPRSGDEPCRLDAPADHSRSRPDEPYYSFNRNRLRYWDLVELQHLDRDHEPGPTGSAAWGGFRVWQTIGSHSWPEWHYPKRPAERRLSGQSGDLLRRSKHMPESLARSC